MRGCIRMSIFAAPPFIQALTALIESNEATRARTCVNSNPAASGRRFDCISTFRLFRRGAR
jgi:hypothetical protein